MEFEEFKSNFLCKISKGKESSLKYIEKNKKVVMDFLSKEKYVLDIVNNLNDIILVSKKFSIFEKVLSHPLLEAVEKEFRESNILIRAFKSDSKDKEKIIEWLLKKTNINPSIRDENGCTALMFAVQVQRINSNIECLLQNGSKYVNLEDYNGNTALFYATESIVIFQKLIDQGADYNHLNKVGETVLMYTCRKNKLRIFEYVLKIPDFNVNQYDYNGKNLPMVLVECSLCKELKTFFKCRSDFDINFVSKSNESLVSHFINQYISELKEKENFLIEKYYKVIQKYGLMMETLVELGCNFNAIIDGDGNTPIMFFILIEDYVSAYYLLKKCPKLDISIKNKYNVNASYMAFFINEDYFKSRPKFPLTYGLFLKVFLEHPTFDHSYLDENKNSLLNYCILKNENDVNSFLRTMNDETVGQMNNKKETSLIIASKLGKGSIVKQLLDNPYVRKNINHTDSYENTALFYAVQLRDQEIIKLLLKNGANPYITNSDGITILETAKMMNAFNIVELIEKNFAVNNSKEKVYSDKKVEENKKLDVKLDNQIRYYRINQYQKEYDSLLKYDFISCYQPSCYNHLIQQWLYIVMFAPKDNSELRTFINDMNKLDNILNRYIAENVLVSLFDLL